MWATNRSPPPLTVLRHDQFFLVAAGIKILWWMTSERMSPSPWFSLTGAAAFERVACSWWGAERNPSRRKRFWQHNISCVTTFPLCSAIYDPVTSRMTTWKPWRRVWSWLEPWTLPQQTCESFNNDGRWTRRGVARKYVGLAWRVVRCAGPA